MTARRASGRAVVSVSGSLSVGVLPVFLVGALTDRIGDDLGFGAGGTGVIIAVFFTAAGVGGIPLGMVSDRIGARRGVRAGVLVSAAAGLVAALWVDAFWQLAVVMAISGSVVGLIDTGAARLITDVVRDRRQGLAFGMKEASVPAASMLAGASIPLVAERFGWRPMFAVGVVAAPVLWFLLPEPGGSRQPAPAGPPEDEPRNRALLVFAVGVALAVGAATAAATFLVPASTSTAGVSSTVAGVVLAAASLASIGSRVGFGWVSDRRPEHTGTVLFAALVVGAVGAGALSIATDTATVVIGAVLVLGGGWGWTGLAFLTAVRATPDTPSTAAGVVLTGLSAGGVGGPAIYGAVASVASYRAAWAAVAGAMVVGAVLIRQAHLERDATASTPEA